MNLENLNQKKIKNIEILLDKLENKIKKSKEAIKFGELLDAYLISKKEIEKLNEIKPISNEIKKQILAFKNENQNEFKLLNQIEDLEIKIFPLKNNLENLISAINKKINQIERSLINIKTKKNYLETLINKEEILKQKNQFEVLKKELLNIDKELLKAKKENQSVIVLNYFRSLKIKEINKVQKFLNKINKINHENIKQNIVKFELLIDTKNTIINQETINLDFAKKLIYQIDMLTSSWIKENVGSKVKLNDKYSNIKIKKAEDSFNKLQAEINKKKEKIGFTKLLKEYSKNKYELKKISETKIIDQKRKEQFLALKKDNEKTLKLLSQIEFNEIKIFPLKKNLENLKLTINKKINQIEYSIVNIKIKKNQLELLIDEQEILNQKKQFEILNQELLNINKDILKTKKENQSLIVLNYSKNRKIQEIKKVRIFLDKTIKVNFEIIKQEIVKFQKEIDMKNSIIKKESNNLDLIDKLISQINVLLSSWGEENISSKIKLNIKYSNNNIKIIEESFDKLQIEINKKKEKIGFTKLLKEYSKTKYELKKLNKAKIITKEAEIKIAELEKTKQSQLKLLKQIEVVEIKIFHLKKHLENIIFVIDRKKNQLEFFVANIEVRKNELKLLIDEKEILENENQLKILDQELKNININISKLRKEKKPVLAFNYLKVQKINEIKKIIMVLRKVGLTNSIKVNQKLFNLQKSIDMRIPIIDEEINNLELAQNLILQMDESISFGSEEDINPNLAFSIKYLNIFYGYKQALFDVNIDIPKTGVTAIIGPSGCGKSTFIRTLNRINDQIPNFRVKGQILYDGEYNIYKLRSVINRYDKLDISSLRTKVGMIFQQPNPFPMSIYKNVTYGPKVRGIKNKAILNDTVEKALKDAGLYEEVKDNLKVLGTSLSGGQQQRLCIARAIANEPEVLLMDEPTSALDPIAAKIVEDLIHKLKEDYTIIVVTHSMQQARRLSDRTAFFYEGKLIEYGETKELFENPKQEETKAYISGKFG